MKRIAGPIRLELAQYRELAAFAQFGSDLDKTTLERLRQGERIVEVLKQPQYDVLKVEQEVVILYALTQKYLKDVKVEKVHEFEKALMEYMETKYGYVLDELRATKALDSDLEAKLREALDTFIKDVNIKDL